MMNESFAIQCGDQFVTPPNFPQFELVPTFTAFPYAVIEDKSMFDDRFMAALADALLVDKSALRIVKIAFPRGYETEAVEEFKSGHGRFHIAGDASRP